MFSVPLSPFQAQESHGLSTGQPSPMVGHQAARVSEQDTTADRPTLPPGPGPGAKISAAALDALEKRVTNALRALQARQERNLEEAVQVLVGQLWVRAHRDFCVYKLELVLVAVLSTTSTCLVICHHSLNSSLSPHPPNTSRYLPLSTWRRGWHNHGRG